MGDDLKNMQDTVSLIWWNVSLSGKGGSPIDEKSKQVIWDTINHFTTHLYVDIIALTEVTPNSIADIRNFCLLDDYDVVEACDKVGGTQYDFCLIYKRESFSLRGKHANISAKNGSETCKAGVRFNLQFNGDSSVFHIVTSHWRSRMGLGDGDGGDMHRKLSAYQIKSHIEGIMSQYERQNLGHPFIILMGDYNDEPFNESIEIMQGTRDKDLVKKKTKTALLYNPFWRELGLNGEFNHSGSYYYKSGNITRWHTFDQMLYSHSFVKGCEWMLVDNCCKVFIPPTNLLDFVTSYKSKIDHLPIMGKIQRRK